MFVAHAEEIIMKLNIIILCLLCVALYFISGGKTVVSNQVVEPNQVVTSVVSDGNSVTEAYEQRRSDIQVKGEGVVLKTLRDDLEGSRHQRFILKLASGQTILIAHNIDISSPVASLQKGDIVQFYGEYEWNNKGGVVHWTHHDPKGRHINGWLNHNDITYQ